MTQGDFETFYPFQAGIGKGAPNNFESSFQGYYGESSATGDDLDDSNDDQENTDGDEGEAGEVGGVEETQQLPCFRELVRAKKRELKAQFGKGRFRIGECGIRPVRLGYNPIVRIGESRTCIGWGVSCDKKCLGICCGPTTCNNWAVIPGNTQAYDNATARFEADLNAWNSCEKGWIPGWRREWRKFKKAGGLNEFKKQSVRCILGTALSDEPIRAPDEVVPPPVPPKVLKGLTKEELLARFNARNQSYKRNAIEDDGKDKTKLYITIGIVAVILIVGGIYIYKTIKKK